MDMNYGGGNVGGGGGQDGVEWGGKWDNCNSIINKYIKKNKKKRIVGLNNFLFKVNPLHVLVSKTSSLPRNRMLPTRPSI